MATQKARILSFLSKHSDIEYDSIGIWEKVFKNMTPPFLVKVKPSTIRARLSELEKDEKIQSVRERRPFKRIKKWYSALEFNQYTLDVVIYASSKQETWRVITYSQDELKIKELMEEMIEYVEEENEDRASQVRYEYGMEVEQVNKAPFEYPIIEAFRTKKK